MVMVGMYDGGYGVYGDGGYGHMCMVMVGLSRTCGW